MIFNQESIQQAQDIVWDMLKLGTAEIDASGQPIVIGQSPNGYPLYKFAIDPVNPSSISGPSQITQEQQLVAATRTYEFDFGSNAPPDTALLNNVRLGTNSTFAYYGVRILLGEGANVAARVYRSDGPTAADNTFYSGRFDIKYAQRTPVTEVPLRIFHEQGVNFTGYQGFQFIRPFRTVQGSLDDHTLTIRLANIAALAITANLFMSVSLEGAIALS